jgi:hypothetical protein
MSEEPAQYGQEKRERGRNALEDTIRAELTTEEIGKLAAVIAFAQRESLGLEAVWSALCSVEPRLTDLPREIEERLASRAKKKLIWAT